MINDKKQAVTGAFGFTGGYIARQLLDKGQKVVTLTNSPQRKSPLQGRVEVRPLSFDDVPRLAESLRGVEVLYNTYWVRFNHGESTFANAVRQSLALFEAAKLAGVERVVHISIANASTDSPFEYYSAKASVDYALKASGLCHAIVRPAALFGAGGLLLNNIAWALRRLPVFAMFGTGEYHMQPVFVEDLAKLMLAQGSLRENTDVLALGPEDFTYKELVATIGKAIGCQRRVMHLPPQFGYLGAKAIGFLMRDVFATREEIGGLMADLLHVPGAAPTCPTRFTDWLAKNADSLGRSYGSELGRRRDKTKRY